MGTARSRQAFCTSDAIPLTAIGTPLAALMLTTNVANEILMSFLAVFKLFHAFICCRFENTTICYHQNNFPSPLSFDCSYARIILWNLL
jgi:hypothetical protein